MAPVNDNDDLSEVLDDDKLPDTYPPDQPLGVDEYGVTAAEERFDEPLPDRVAREEPDAGGQPAPEPGVGPLVEPDEGMAADGTAEALASEVEGPADEQLAEGDLTSGDETTRDVATERAEDRTAEEGAMRLTEGP